MDSKKFIFFNSNANNQRALFQLRKLISFGINIKYFGPGSIASLKFQLKLISAFYKWKPL